MKPLEGVRIVSVEQYAAAPYGTALLAGMGAEVIRIENPTAGGDAGRRTGPHLLGDGDSQYFQTWNLNKKSVALDLKSANGRAQFEALALTSDAVVNNLRGDQAAKIGLDYAALGKLKPSLVCLHVTAYGRENERAGRPGYDYMMQAESGLMSLTGEPGSPPSRTGGPSMVDHATAMTAMVGLLGALLGAKTTGKGCDVDVSLMDVALHQLGYAATWFLNSGDLQTQQPRSSHFAVTPVQTFTTQDGWIMVMCMTDRFWEAMLGVMGRSDLGRDPRFASNPARVTHRSELTEILDAEFRRRTTAEWLDLLSDILPVGPVNDLGQALSSEFIARTGMIQNAPHPSDPGFRVVASPIKINGQRAQAQVCSAMGADTDAILGALADAPMPEFAK